MINYEPSEAGKAKIAQEMLVFADHRLFMKLLKTVESGPGFSKEITDKIEAGRATYLEAVLVGCVLSDDIRKWIVGALAAKEGWGNAISLLETRILRIIEEDATGPGLKE